MSWHKLVTRDNWGHMTVHIGGPVVKGTVLPLEECPPTLKNGTYKIRWPDGSQEEIPVVMKEHRHTVGDMGHDYEVATHLPYFVFKYKGATINALATGLGVEVWRDDP